MKTTTTKKRRTKHEEEGSEEVSPRDLFVEKLAESGLTPRDAEERLGFEVLSPDDIAKLGEAHYPMGWAFRLPYFDAKGKRTGFYRLRYLSVEGFAARTEKKLRYTQPSKAIAGIYLAPFTFSGLGWEDVFSDPDVSLLITEGELKAISGCRAGYPTIGLGGVDTWRATKRGVPFLPELERIKWSGRRVYLVFDSDLASNPNVLRALSKLCVELTTRGASPAVLRLPPGENGAKVGLDDYLVAGGKLPPLIEAAEEFDLSEALVRLNDEVAYLRENDAIVELATGTLLAREVFVNGTYANRTYTEVIAGPVPRVVRKCAAKEWLAWPHRFELKRLVYRPGAPRLPEDGTYNAWSGWGVEPKKNGGVALWRELLDFLFSGERPEAREWFERWCAYPLQRPGTKLYTSVLLWGEEQGTGKTLVFYTLRDIYGRENASVIGQDDLHGSFNYWAARKQFVLGEEISGSDKRADADRLKGFITQDRLTLKLKYQPEYTIDDCVNYAFTSQHPDAFFLEEKDRRMFVHEVRGTPLAREFYERYDAWLRSSEGPEAVFYHLLRLDLGDFNPRGFALRTRSKEAMIALGKGDAAALVDELLTSPSSFLAARSIACDVLQPSQLVALLNSELPRSVSMKTLGVLLRKRARTISKPVHARFYVLANPERWLAASERDLYEHWRSAFGPTEGEGRAKF